jgi:O-antigen ligase
MNPHLAALIYAIGIAGLFYLDRDNTVRTSKALWIPVIYMWITGSRAVSVWLNMTPANGATVQLEGSPLDAAIAGALLVIAIGVLSQRAAKCRILLAANWPILLYFLYCLISASWSYHPEIAFRRWIRATSDPAMILIVVTDSQPMAAFKRLISRVGFILLPTSLLLIKYFDNVGRFYSPIGDMENTGVTTNKNILGVVLLVITLATLWHLLTLLHDKARANRRRHLIAQCALLGFGIVLLNMAHSATSIACSCLGGALILATNHKWMKHRPARVQVLCLALLVAGALTFFLSGHTGVAGALGRDSTLSGRTDIWAALLPTVSNPVLGAGYESYWISPSAEILWRTLSDEGWWHPEIVVTEAHNAYIEMYANLGWIGIGLVSFILISGYRRAIAAFRKNPSAGSLMLSYIVVSGVYSITEAAFRSPDPMWIFLLWAIVGSTGVSTGLVNEGSERHRDRAGRRRSSPIVTVEPKLAYRNASIG